MQLNKINYFTQVFNIFNIKIFATFFQKHRKALSSNVFEMGLLHFQQKCVSDPREELHFCRPTFPSHLLFKTQIMQPAKSFDLADY
jgi:hypothetical protein